MIEHDNKKDHEYTTHSATTGLDICIFDQDYLSLNIHQKEITTLAYRQFWEADIPALNHSELYLLPENQSEYQPVFGCVNFELPIGFQRNQQTNAILFKKLLEHFRAKRENKSISNLLLIAQSDELLIADPIHEEMRILLTIEGYDEAYFEIHSKINTHANPSRVYSDIVHVSTIWAELQNFVLQSTPIPYSNTNHRKIFIGTTGSGTLSNSEIALEQLLGLYGEGAQVPSWGTDINGHDLSILEHHLTDNEQAPAIAHDVILAKRKLIEDNQPITPITQEDIVKSMSRVLSHHRQSNRGNNHRD